jgi:hypothetical protein
VAEPFVFESHRAHRSIFPAILSGVRAVSTGREILVERLMRFRLLFPGARFRALVLHRNILLTCLLRSHQEFRTSSSHECLRRGWRARRHIIGDGNCHG